MPRFLPALALCSLALLRRLRADAASDLLGSGALRRRCGNDRRNHRRARRRSDRCRRKSGTHRLQLPRSAMTGSMPSSRRPLRARGYGLQASETAAEATHALRYLLTTYARQLSAARDDRWRGSIDLAVARPRRRADRQCALGSQGGGSMSEAPEESPNFLDMRVRRGSGVRRLNRVPLIVAAIMLLLLAGAVTYTYQMRLAEMRRRAAEAEARPEPANSSDLFREAPSSGLIEANRRDAPQPPASVPSERPGADPGKAGECRG